jgi:transcription elongation factor Elf1
MIEVDIECPYCGEAVTLVIDETGGRAQIYIEDCGVCCQPIESTARAAGDEFEVSARRGDT